MTKELETAQILPPDAVKLLTDAYAIATHKPEGTLSRASCIDRAIDAVRRKYPEFFKKE